MPDEATVDETGTDTGADSSGAGTAADAQAGRTFSQDDLNRINADERRKRTEAEKARKAAEEEAATLRAEVEKHRLAQMSELERAQTEAAAAKAEVEAARAEAVQAQRESMRAMLIAADGADLPPAYRDRVTGDDAETVRASIEAQRAEFQALRLDIAADIAASTPEQLATRYGEDAGKKLAERLLGKPASIGAPSAANPNQLTPAVDPDIPSNSWGFWANRGKRKSG